MPENLALRSTFVYVGFGMANLTCPKCYSVNRALSKWFEPRRIGAC